MEKTVSGSNKETANKEGFRNQPHANTSASDMKNNLATEAKNAVSEARTAITEQAGPAMNYLRDNFANVSDKASVYFQDAGSLVRRYPFYSLIGAVAVGAFIGMAVSRRSYSQD